LEFSFLPGGRVSGRWESHPVLARRHRISALAYAIKGKCIWEILEFMGPACVDHVWLAGLLLAPRSWWSLMLLMP
jgi:hypothetical protein